MFFPQTGQVDLARRAKLICDKCPVKAQCLEEGLKEREGIWGGTTPKDRRRLRRANQINIRMTNSSES